MGSATFNLAIQTDKTKKLFLSSFKQVMISFASSIQGITDETIQQNYAALILDRLLVLFFLQHQGLLDNNRRYLQDHLDRMHKMQTDTFFATFFLPLCHTTLNGQTTPDKFHPTFGHIPVLAHPAFQKHHIEASYQPQIPDESLYNLFHFLEEFHWELTPTHLGAVPCDSPTIHHDIFADLLEQRSNQKQTGTYYTTDDVTNYIANNTILPALFHRIQKHSPALMHPHSTIWQHLIHSPDRYIPNALQHPDYLPEETAQEYQARQQRLTELLTLLREGKIQTINAMVTYNLDILRFTVDVISTHNDLELVVVLFGELERLTILDPTCGSGAFLYAALVTLKTVYMACLQRMRGQAQGAVPTESAVRAILQRASAAPNMDYFAVHHIITRNLYGVDLMDEAIEVCTLRLYLSLLAQTQRIEDLPPFHEIPIQVKAGNALVGDVYLTAFPEVAQSGGFAVVLGNPPYIEHSKVRYQYAIDGYEEKSCGNLYAAILERSLALLHPNGSSLGLLLPMSICGGQRFGSLRTLLTQSLSSIWLANFDIFPCRLFGNGFQRHSLLLGRREVRRQVQQAPPLRASEFQADLHTTRIHRWYPGERPFLIDLLRYTPSHQLTTQTSLQQSPVFPKLASTLHTEILQKIMMRSNGHTIGTIQHDYKTPHFVYYQEATNYWIKALCHIPFYRKDGTVMTPPHGRLLFFRDEQTARSIMALMNSSLFYLWFTTYSDGFHLAHSLVTSFPCSQELLTGERNDGAEAISPLTDFSPLPQMAGSLEADLLAHIRLGTRNKETRPLSSIAGKNGQKDYSTIELAEYRASYSKPIIDEIDRHLAHTYAFTKDELHFITNYDRKYRMKHAQDWDTNK